MAGWMPFPGFGVANNTIAGLHCRSSGNNRPVLNNLREDILMLTVPLEKIADYVDKPLGTSEWVFIDQDRINAFADVTLDHQFIHVDAEKASATPFGSAFIPILKLIHRRNL